MRILSYGRPRGPSRRKTVVCTMVGAFIVIGLCAALGPVKRTLHRTIDQVLLWSMRDYDSGKDARKWLNDSFSNEWSANPFPSDCVDSVQGLSDRSNEADYWLRVNFKQACAQIIIENLRDGLVQPRSVTITTGRWAPATSTAAPSFWNPQEVEDPITFKICHHGPDPKNIGREIDISISKKKGIAYIRLIQF